MCGSAARGAERSGRRVPRARRLFPAGNRGAFHVHRRLPKITTRKQSDPPAPPRAETAAEREVFVAWARLLSRGAIEVNTDAELAESSLSASLPGSSATLPLAPPSVSAAARFVFAVEAASSLGVYREVTCQNSYFYVDSCTTAAAAAARRRFVV